MREHSRLQVLGARQLPGWVQPPPGHCWSPAQQSSALKKLRRRSCASLAWESDFCYTPKIQLHAGHSSLHVVLHGYTRHALMQVENLSISTVGSPTKRGTQIRLQVTCRGGGGGCDMEAGGGLPMVAIFRGGGGPNEGPPLGSPLTPPPPLMGGVDCVGVLPVAYSHWALIS